MEEEGEELDAAEEAAMEEEKEELDAAEEAAMEEEEEGEELDASDEATMEEEEEGEESVDATDEATMEEEEEEETSKTNGTRDNCIRSCVREALPGREGRPRGRGQGRQSPQPRGGRRQGEFPKPRELVECIDECDTRVCVLTCVADFRGEVARALVQCVQGCDTGSGSGDDVDDLNPETVPDVVPQRK